MHPSSTFLAAAVSLSSLMPFFSASGAETRTETRPVTGFTRVALNCPFDVYVEQGPAFAVSVTSDADVLPHLTTEVRGDALLIEEKGRLPLSGGKNEVHITMPDFRGVAIHGSGDAKIKGFKEGKDVSLSVKGSGDIHFEGNAARMSVAIEGSGDVTLGAGKADQLKVAIDGSGDLRAAKLTVKDADVSLQGSGDAELTVEKGTLRASMNGSGDLVWHGDAKVAALARQGSGDVTHR